MRAWCVEHHCSAEPFGKITRKQRTHTHKHINIPILMVKKRGWNTLIGSMNVYIYICKCTVDVLSVYVLLGYSAVLLLLSLLNVYVRRDGRIDSNARVFIKMMLKPSNKKLDIRTHSQSSQRTLCFYLNYFSKSKNSNEKCFFGEKKIKTNKLGKKMENWVFAIKRECEISLTIWKWRGKDR